VLEQNFILKIVELITDCEMKLAKGSFSTLTTDDTTRQKETAPPQFFSWPRLHDYQL
jgi:hypothetical protein